MKNYICKKYNFRIYCVRGNHEARPQDVPDMHLIYDEDVNGDVYIQDRWPQIRYFKDWGKYTINNHSVIVIGGAYSVDKYYRLSQGYKWFENEQLSTDEMLQCMADLTNATADIVLTHTCPYCWRPIDLFLPGIDQSTVDNTMEHFLEEIMSYRIYHGIWCFGHYHQDRIEAPYVEMFYTDTEDLEDVYQRWEEFDKTHELPWWLHKGPNFYIEDYVNDREEYLEVRNQREDK